ncbi:MAG: AMP-binding protein, partial [Myxococcales bacterium]|nr:AMP-binding protein [Myxococcales bacterium]
QDDLVVGTHIANRTRAETEPLIGFFVNTLALRADFSDQPSFRHLLARLKTVVETAYEYQDLPYEMLVEELRLQRTSAYSPLCQVTFAMQTALSAHLDLPGQQVEVLRREGAAARFDLTLGISESPAGLEIAWRYNTDLFAQETIQTLADQFGCLLEQIVQHPTTPIARLALTRTPPPPPPQELAAAPAPILAAIQHWAEQQPAAPAVLDGLTEGTAAYSWSELATSIATIGAGLAQLGVGPEVRVAVCLERGPGAVVAALAIWEAGGTYVPIDPEFPP